jgi:hypothetical protein
MTRIIKRWTGSASPRLGAANHGAQLPHFASFNPPRSLIAQYAVAESVHPDVAPVWWYAVRLLQSAQHSSHVEPMHAPGDAHAPPQQGCKMPPQVTQLPPEHVSPDPHALPGQHG